LIEIAILFGKEKMTELAHSLGRTFETNIPTLESGFQFEKLVSSLRPGYDIDPQAFDLLRGLLALKVSERLTAREALKHPFLN
jgi:serine/threonine protein kinase